MGRTLWWIPVTRAMPEKLIHNILKLYQNVWMASSLCSAWKATMLYHCDTEQRFIPREQRGEGKEKILSTCFLNGGFQKYDQAFILRQWLMSTLLRSPCSSPSPFSVPLSASEQKHTAHPARRSAPAKSSLPAPQLFSFTPALFPGRALTAAYTLK